MKYFTSEWWNSGCEGAEELFHRYQRYLESVKDRLPERVLAFNAHHTLHDSQVQSITSNFEERSLQIVLLGWDVALSNRTRYRLFFDDVRLFEQQLPQQYYVESELGDIGYWEWEAVAEANELRLLFASNATFRIRFKEFSFAYEPVPA
jgi:Protein of unknown function (DUF4085)